MNGKKGVFVFLERTISDSLARAGRRVGGASRWRSMPSNASTNLERASRSMYFSILVSSAVNAASVSQRPGVDPFCRASPTRPTVLSNKWRAVTHSADLTTAYFKSDGESLVSVCSSSLMMALLPVASVPWTTILRHGAIRGWIRVVKALIWASRQGKLEISDARRSSGSSKNEAMFKAFVVS